MPATVDMSKPVIIKHRVREIVLNHNSNLLRADLPTKRVEKMSREGLDAARGGKQFRHPDMDLAIYSRDTSPIAHLRLHSH